MRTPVFKDRKDALASDKGAGTVTMFLTAGVYSFPCGKPSRTIAELHGEPPVRDTAMECLAGPVLSVLIAIAFVYLWIAYIFPAAI